MDGELVLVADDDPDILALVAFRLKRSGYRVATARDGDEALRLARAAAPALVVLDVMMPGLDGYAVLRELRADESTREIPVILLTARAQESDVVRGFRVGADDYVKKPFSPNELVVRIGAALERRTAGARHG